MKIAASIALVSALASAPLWAGNDAESNDSAALDARANQSEQIRETNQATPLAACQSVTLNVKNNKSVKIKALKIEYKSKEDGKWRSEGFSDKQINPGQVLTVKSGASLEHVEGHTMTNIKLHYKKWCGGKWSITYTDTDSTFSSPKCVYGKTYRVDSRSGGC